MPCMPSSIVVPVAGARVYCRGLKCVADLADHWFALRVEKKIKRETLSANPLCHSEGNLSTTSIDTVGIVDN